MIDGCKYTIQYGSPGELAEVFQKPEFNFVRTDSDQYTGAEIQRFRFRNLALAANFHLCQIRVSGSLTTFWHGKNYVNLSHPELVEAVGLICSHLRVVPERVPVSQFEIGIVTPTPLPPREYIDLILNYKKKPFFKIKPPAWSAHPLETFCRLQQFGIKVYDTATWHKLPGVNLLRFEIRFMRMEKARNVLKTRHAITLADLIVRENMATLGQFAVKTYREIDKGANLILQPLTLAQVQQVCCGEHPQYWRKVRALISPSAYKRQRSQYKAIKHELESQEKAFADLDTRISAAVQCACGEPI